MREGYKGPTKEIFSLPFELKPEVNNAEDLKSLRPNRPKDKTVKVVFVEPQEEKPKFEWRHNNRGH